MQSLEEYFAPFRENIIGINNTFVSPFGEKTIIYADWTASGRMYAPIEERMTKQVMPLVANTHTETTVTGTAMTKAYHDAKAIIKNHVGANENDVLLFSGSGMTAAVNKLQRILGLRIPERLLHYTERVSVQRSSGFFTRLFGSVQSTTASSAYCKSTIRSLFDEVLPVSSALRPLVLCTHMEHHSNQTTWLETIADVEIIREDEHGLVDVQHLKSLLEKYSYKKNKIAAVTGCSNVTGIQTPYHDIAEIMHQHGGLCFVDFACSAPYVSINMHPSDRPLAYLDAIYFSPHKFLGGPGTSGVLIFNKSLYNNKVPDKPGGGTVVYTNPWQVHEFIEDIETREDGGTPPFLQAIKTAMAVKLKEQMGVSNILAREEELLEIIFSRLEKIINLTILEGRHRHRLGVVSFFIKDAHHNIIVKLLNDKFGVQTRGGCACAGTYGHYLLHVEKQESERILQQIHEGNLYVRPGWIRMSIHPTMTNAELDQILSAIEQVAANWKEWEQEYEYNAITNEFAHRNSVDTEQQLVDAWFNDSLV